MQLVYFCCFSDRTAKHMPDEKCSVCFVHWLKDYLKKKNEGQTICVELI